MLLKELISMVSMLGGCGGLERPDFSWFLLWQGVVLLKELISMVSMLGGCGGLERPDFSWFLLWQGVVLSKELIFNSFYFVRMCWSSKN